jgi:hypothetical protein
LGDFATSPIVSTLKHFRSEYQAYVKAAGSKAVAPARAKTPEPQPTPA